jgi:hypothetical protein
MLHIIGLHHSVQVKSPDADLNEGQQAFAQCLQASIQQVKPVVIAEEHSEEVLKLASITLKGAAQGIPVPPGNPGLSGATGQLRSVVVQGAVSGAYNTFAGVGAETIELGITAAGTVATPVAQLSTQTLTNVATGIGLAKFAFDLGTFSYGYFFACH